MRKTFTVLALLGLLSLGASDAFAGTPSQARKRSRDGSCGDCQRARSRGGA